MPTPLDNPRDRLILPFLGPVYDYLAQPGVWVLIRIITGAMLVMSGWPKIQAPFAMAGMMGGLVPFGPGWLWSLLVALTEFAGGILIVIGLFTRPAAVAATILLLVTLSFHVNNPYGTNFLTPEGVAFITGEGAQYFTDAARARLAPDGGASFLSGVQQKAEFTSIFWACLTALFAAFGGGYLSLDKMVLKREF